MTLTFKVKVRSRSKFVKKIAIWSYVNNFVTKHNRDIELQTLDKSKPFLLFEVMSDDLDVSGQCQVKVTIF